MITIMLLIFEVKISLILPLNTMTLTNDLTYILLITTPLIMNMLHYSSHGLLNWIN